MTKRIFVVLAALALVCACTGQGGLPPMPGDVIGIDASMVVGDTDQQTGDVSLTYSLYITNNGDTTLEKVILKDFLPPSDVVMRKTYFEITNLKPGETREVAFDVLVLGWGLHGQRQQWEVDFTIRIEEGSAFTEQDIFYYAIELYSG